MEDTGLRERAGSQSHFIDLCKVLGEKAPTEADPRSARQARLLRLPALDNLR